LPYHIISLISLQGTFCKEKIAAPLYSFSVPQETGRGTEAAEQRYRKKYTAWKAEELI
jgi:hypothetical protein